MTSLWLSVRVKAYSGYKADERPIAFEYKGREHRIVEILDRWYGELDDYFKVRTEERDVYILRCRRGPGVWFLALER